MMHLLDANTFIEAKNRYYGFDICPGYWDWIDALVPNDGVKSITLVYDELVDGNDELAEWIKVRKDSGLFLDVSDAPTQQQLAQIAAMVQAGPYRPAAKANFLAKADPWLVAKAKILGGVVVTHEVPAPDALKKVPLPNICEAFGVPYIDTFDLLRKVSTSFHLAG